MGVVCEWNRLALLQTHPSGLNICFQFDLLAAGEFSLKMTLHHHCYCKRHSTVYGSMWPDHINAFHSCFFPSFQDPKSIQGRLWEQPYCFELPTIWSHPAGKFRLWRSVVSSSGLAQCLHGAGKWNNAGKTIVRFYLCRQWHQSYDSKCCNRS